MDKKAYFEYINSHGADLFTVVLLPEADGKFPTVIVRTPYVDWLEDKTEEFIVELCRGENTSWTDRGYAMVIQYCRGRGKSSGDCIPYIYEGMDTNSLYDWVRKQGFYNGEIILKGGSYLSSVHYCAAPYKEDIKGAIFAFQDTDLYNLCYRNGFFKRNLIGEWYVGMYKAKSKTKKNFTRDSFDMLPLCNFSKAVFGEDVPPLDKMLLSPNRDNDFWRTHEGGVTEKHSLDNADFPMLFTTGFYDIYTGGIFDMWRALKENVRNKSALVVSPYDHGDGCPQNSIVFKNGKRTEKFGTNYEIDWCDYVVNGASSPFEVGKVTYYTLFENQWHADDFADCKTVKTLVLGDKEVSYIYDPQNAPGFKGGLSCSFGGAEYQDKPYQRDDVVTLYTEPFECDAFIKGKAKMRLYVSSDCEDTCFYARISIEKPEGDFPLRDDITSLCHQLGNYTPNTKAMLDFTFDEHSFLIKQGERLRIDISSANRDHYVPHTNYKGLYSIQTRSRKANNTLYLADSTLILPCEFR